MHRHTAQHTCTLQDMLKGTSIHSLVHRHNNKIRATEVARLTSFETAATAVSIEGVFAPDVLPMCIGMQVAWPNEIQMHTGAVHTTFIFPTLIKRTC